MTVCEKLAACSEHLYSNIIAGKLFMRLVLSPNYAPKSLLSA